MPKVVSDCIRASGGLLKSALSEATVRLEDLCGRFLVNIILIEYISRF